MPLDLERGATGYTPMPAQKTTSLLKNVISQLRKRGERDDPLRLDGSILDRTPDAAARAGAATPAAPYRT